MLRDGVEFHDLGSQYFAHHDKEQLTKQLLRRLRDSASRWSEARGQLGLFPVPAAPFVTVARER
jgi:hypothetical protein